MAKDKSKNAKKTKKEASLIFLPCSLPPDQMIFEFLYNLPASDQFWSNKVMFTKSVFDKSSNEIVERLNLGFPPIKIVDAIDSYKESHVKTGGVVRDMFKRFVISDDFKSITMGKVEYNPYRYWVKNNKEVSEQFKNDFIEKLRQIMHTGYGINSSVFSSYFSN